jgi:hypothetical protein
MNGSKNPSTSNNDNFEIEDLYQRNRDLRNARITLAIGVITIFLALWAIILAFISQIITPESVVDVCIGTYNDLNLCNCSEMKYNVSQSATNYFSLVQFLIHNNVFNVLIFFGILLTIILFLIWRLFARHLCMAQIKNYEKMYPELVISKDGKISDTVKNLDFVTFVIVELLWILSSIELVRIWPGKQQIPQFFNNFAEYFTTNSHFIQQIACRFNLDLGFDFLWLIVGWFVIWLVWKIFTKITVINSLIKICKWFISGLAKIWSEFWDC